MIPVVRASGAPRERGLAVGRGLAEQIGLRFRLAKKRLGFREDREPLRTDLFQPPVLAGQQMRLF